MKPRDHVKKHFWVFISLFIPVCIGCNESQMSSQNGDFENNEGDSSTEPGAGNNQSVDTIDDDYYKRVSEETVVDDSDAAYGTAINETDKDSDTSTKDAGGRSTTEVSLRFKVVLKKLGRLGHCFENGVSLTVTIEPQENGDATLATASFFKSKSGISDSVDSGLSPDGGSPPDVGPIEEVFGPLEIAREQEAQLVELLANIPEEDCGIDHVTNCDPFSFMSIEVDESVYHINPCMWGLEGPCLEYAGALYRASSFIERLFEPAQEKSESPDCYSPLKNLHLAYSIDAVGCLCDWPNQNVCVDGKALICEYINNSCHAKWVAVEDGPCMPQVCSREKPELSLKSCLQYYQSCHELPQGGFCAY